MYPSWSQLHIDRTEIKIPVWTLFYGHRKVLQIDGIAIFFCRRERVKRRRAEAKTGPGETVPGAAVNEKKQPDLAELSRSLPPGWQVCPIAHHLFNLYLEFNIHNDRPDFNLKMSSYPSAPVEIVYLLFVIYIVWNLDQQWFWLTFNSVSLGNCSSQGTNFLQLDGSHLMVSMLFFFASPFCDYYLSHLLNLDFSIFILIIFFTL